jgi:hypothetical protein
MKKAVNVAGWIFVVLTILALILTLITTYNMGFYISYFDSYYTLQSCIFLTMVIWAINLYNTTSGKDRYVYFTICMLFALGAILFRIKSSVY